LTLELFAILNILRVGLFLSLSEVHFYLLLDFDCEVFFTYMWLLGFALSEVIHNYLAVQPKCLQFVQFQCMI